jgi:D-aspartate ligase
MTSHPAPYRSIPKEDTVITSSPHHPGAAAAAAHPGPGPALAPDRSVPALIVKIGAYPLHHGGVGAIRTLGRLGIGVYAITEDRFSPAALSRYCRQAFVWPTTGCEEPAELIGRLAAIGAEIRRQTGRKAVPVATDEEAAVLLAEHAGELSEHFLLPQVAPGLPRQLASKQGLYELCRAHGVPTPASAFPSTPAELAQFAREATFPVVAKNLEAWTRREAPVVAGTTVYATAAELLAAARAWGEEFSVILQEYIPREYAQDWIVHLYCDADAQPEVEFTGIKMRSWPPHAGMTACAKAVPNPELASAAARFCRQIGFSGIGDLDWRLDLRDGQYKLVDFNPRAGAQFRLFETGAGVDVVRAMHLDLTGRAIPASPQADGRKLIVENIDPLAQLAYRRGTGASPLLADRHAQHTELAWAAADDPVPFLAMLARLAGPGLRHLTRTWRARRVRRNARHLQPDTPGPAGGGGATLPTPVPVQVTGPLTPSKGHLS